MDNREIKLQRLLNTDGKSLTAEAYNSVIGMVILWGILVNILIYRLFAPYIIKLDYRILTLGYLITAIGCFSVVVKSHKPAYSFLGFTGLAAAMGTVLTAILSMYDGLIIYRAFLATGIVVSSMMIVSMIFPGFFQSLGKTLSLAMIGSIVVEMVGSVLMHLPMYLMDYIVVIIFSGYIGYDWTKAQAYPKTLNNAIDSAADIYVDVLNIFIRILSIMGKKDD